MKYIALLIIFLCSSLASADTVSLSQLELKIQELVIGYDDAAFVKIVPTTAKAPDQLPGVVTPTTGNAVIPTNNLPFEKLEVVLYSKLKNLPPETRELISSSLKLHAAQVSITFKKTLPGYKRIRPLENIESALNLLVNAFKNFKPVEIKPDTAPQGASPSVASGPSLNWSEIQEGTQKALPYVIGYFVLLSLIFLAAVHQLHRIKTSLVTHINQLTKAVESSSENDEPVTVNRTVSEDKSPSRPQTATANQEFADWTTASLASLLSDCYWSKQDEYAAFIWSELKPHARGELLAALDYMSNYARYLRSMTPSNLNFASDPNYLQPLKLYSTSNEQLSHLVRKHPAYYELLSEMRRNELSLTVEERLKIAGMKQEGLRIQDFEMAIAKLGPDKTRILESKTKIYVQSAKDEQYLNSLEQPTMPQMEQIPSLVWIKFLNDNYLKEIIKGFSAKDLASIMIGPEDILQRLKSCIPQNKLKLLDSYKDKVSPDRNASAFLFFHEAVIIYLRIQMAEKDSDGGESSSREVA